MSLYEYKDAFFPNVYLSERTVENLYLVFEHDTLWMHLPIEIKCYIAEFVRIPRWDRRARLKSLYRAPPELAIREFGGTIL